MEFLLKKFICEKQLQLIREMESVQVAIAKISVRERRGLFCNSICLS